MSMPAHSVTALIGPAGCGKSTVPRTINRLHELIPGGHVDGQVLLDGKNDPDVDPVELRRTVGMVFQRPNPFPTMSVRDNVSAVHRQPPRRRSSSSGLFTAPAKGLPGRVRTLR